MRRRILSKGLTVAVIILFIGIAVQPSIATIPIDDEVDVDEKEYLFQTIIDIANNPDVKDFLKQNKHNRFTFDYDFKGLNSKLLAKNPRLLTRLRVTRPTLTHDYLDKIYNIGSDIIDMLGEEQVYEIMESIIFTNKELYDGLNNIVLNDEELSNRLDTLSDLLGLIICLCCIALSIAVSEVYFIVRDFFQKLVLSLCDIGNLLCWIGNLLYVIFVGPLYYLFITSIGLVENFC